MVTKPKEESVRQTTTMAKKPPDAAAVKLVSEALTDAFRRLFAAGSYALVALYVGTLTMLGGMAGQERFFWAGFGVVIATLLGVTFVGWLKRRDVQKQLRENAGIANAMQEFAMQATKVTLDLQSLLLVNVDSVGKTLVAAEPVLKVFGVQAFAEQSNLNARIVESLESVSKIVSSAQDAISRADPTPLYGYAEELATLNERIVAALKAPRPTIEQIRTELTANVSYLQDCVAEFCGGVESMAIRTQQYVGTINAVARAPFARPLLESAGLAGVLNDGQRLEIALATVREATQSLTAAVKKGTPAELLEVLEKIKQLKAVLASKPEAP